MDKYYGFDLGDAESAVSCLHKDGGEPEMCTVQDEKSFITAFAQLKDGQLLVGEKACYAPDAVLRKIRFKSRYLTDPSVKKDITGFAAGVLGELYTSAQLLKGSDDCFYVGCPAGWDKAAREEYREIFEKIGYPPTKIISESRAALVSACQSRHLQVGYDILKKPVLVIDVGSSTTDFAYIMGGKEVQLQTGGEVFFGGGIMDEILLEEAVNASSNPKKIRKIFEESEPWKNYCEFAARRLKEKYFSDEEYWEKNECSQIVTIRHTTFPVRLTLKLNKQIADKLLNTKLEKLENRSFREMFIDSLKEASSALTEKQPEMIFLTGGVSKLPAMKGWCREVFPDSVLISGAEPEFSVSKGLAYCGRIDDELRAFKEEVDLLISSTVVERIVSKHIPELYKAAVRTLIDPIIEEAAWPVVDRWRTGQLEKLADINGELQQEIDFFLHSDKARSLLTKPITSWLKTVAYDLEEYTIPICTRHNVPYSALNLNSYLAVQDIEIQMDAEAVFAINEITWTIDTLVSLIVGFLCGGNGIAVIASGLPGILAGAVISLLVLALGKDKMQEAILNANIPVPIRRMIPKMYLKARLDVVSEEVKKNLYQSLEQEKNDQISERVAQEISEQIETCLVHMAEVVEIPLG
ncbi:MAG: hypothetical protein E7185_07680 [Erysipelotrichaceae bacterium]|nr:hypothetical protein [Erysipelotrichaceae bacterium]